MKKNNDFFTRRNFIKTTGAAVGGSMVAAGPILSFAASRPANRKMRVALVGTGVRGERMYGRDLLQDYGEYVELVGICDKNPGRLRVAHNNIKPNGPAFTDLDEMLSRTKPEWLIVTTWDWEHHSCIIKGLEHGCHIICEKPLTIDEDKAEMIVEAEKKYGRQIIVTFNYRWVPHRSKLKELLMNGTIGDIRSAEFHWHIRHGHLQRYMQRWHGEANRGGTLWVHKSTHHFDLLNWWLDSDPEEVHAHADLEIFGSNGPFRGDNCRNCAHTQKCPYYWDITKDDRMRSLYADNEHYDGYIRDNCVFRNQIDIYDKHSAVIKYANNVFVNYSLTAESDFEGFWIAFNGTKGRIEGKEGGWHGDGTGQEWRMQLRGREPETIFVPRAEGGHWGGDPLMMDRLFKNPDVPDPLELSAGTRDGVMSIMVGIAARKSAESGKSVKIADLTSIRPQAIRPKS